LNDNNQQTILLFIISKYHPKRNKNNKDKTGTSVDTQLIISPTTREKRREEEKPGRWSTMLTHDTSNNANVTASDRMELH